MITGTITFENENDAVNDVTIDSPEDYLRDAIEQIPGVQKVDSLGRIYDLNGNRVGDLKIGETV